MPRQQLVNTLIEIRNLQNQVYILMKQKKPDDQLIDILKNILRIFPLHPIANYLLHYYLLLKGNTKKANKFKIMALAVSPCCVLYQQTQNSVAQIFSVLKELYNADQNYSNTIYRQDLWWRTQVRIYLNKMEYFLAHWIVKALNSLQNGNSSIISKSFASQISMMFFHVGNYRYNLDYIRQESGIFGGKCLRFANTSALAFLSKEYELSEEYNKKCLAVDSTFPRAYYIKSFYLYATNRAQQAIQAVRKSLSYLQHATIYKIKLIIILILSKIQQRQQIVSLLQQCMEQFTYFKTQDTIVMENYWYSFLYFCCGVLKSLITNPSYQSVEVWDKILQNPLIIQITQFLDQFIIRGNVQRAWYSDQVYKMIRNALGKGNQYKYLMKNIQPGKSWYPLPCADDGKRKQEKLQQKIKFYEMEPQIEEVD